jgi:tRNA G37 N-methylase Trm5
MLLFVGVAGLVAPAKAQQGQEKPLRDPDVIYVPTPQEVVDKMLEMADVRKGEIVYDLGCGDGRIPVTAARKYGVKAFGWDINPVRVKESLENVSKNNVQQLVTIKLGDIFELDLSKADVITLYLLPQLNVKLIPQLEKLKPGCRIVSHDFNMEGVKPKREISFTPPGGRDHRIYLWVTPLERERRN